jgi:hypothetical protein
VPIELSPPAAEKETGVSPNDLFLEDDDLGAWLEMVQFIMVFILLKFCSTKVLTFLVIYLAQLENAKSMGNGSSWENVDGFCSFSSKFISAYNN